VCKRVEKRYTEFIFLKEKNQSLKNYIDSFV